MEVKASLKYARIGAFKARLVANLVRGQEVNKAIRNLTFSSKKAGLMIKKLIESAASNIQNQVMDVDNLYVKTITVDEGPVLKRFRPRAQGRASGIKKKTSHINVVLAER